MKIIIQLTGVEDGYDYDAFTSELCDYASESHNEAQVDAWLDYEVGDPATDDYVRGCSAREWAFHCTRHRGHTGNHAASGADRILHVWDQE